MFSHTDEAKGARLSAFRHTAEAVESSKPGEGFTGWNLDNWARENGWQGVGLLPVSLTRDSDYLVKANWDAAFQELEAQFGKDCLAVAGFTHWACGWVDVGTFDTGKAGLLEAVEAMRKRLDDYPILNEDLTSMYEWDEYHPSDGVCYSENAGDCPCREMD